MMSNGPGDNGEGGFIAPSPAASSQPPTTSSTSSLLPKQRTQPLRPGSMKETDVISHIDQSILTINRRHAKKFSSLYESYGDQDQGQQGQLAPESDSDRGYESFTEVAKDIEGLVDLVWVTGTPTLQIPYFISLAVLVNSYLGDFPFSAEPTFRLLNKLDYIFASLVLGRDAETETAQPLPGFETRRNIVTMTEKVRIKSITETSRVAVVEAMERGNGNGSGNGGMNGMDGVDEDDESMPDDDDDDDDDGVAGIWEMEAARVYRRTIQLLGDELGQHGGEVG